MALAFLTLAVLFLAFANGANDNFKGVATLYGSGRVGYKVALSWATLTTLAGSAAALYLGSHLLATFSGKGIVPDAHVGTPPMLLAVAVGAAGTVLLATWRGLPISTTHALVGGLCGAGLVTAGSAVQLSGLLGVLVAPLLLSPLAATVLTFFLYRFLRRWRLRCGIDKESCVCVAVGSEAPWVALEPARVEPARVESARVESARTVHAIDATATATVTPRVVMHQASCRARLTGRLVGLEAQTVLDALHFLSAGAVGFARGLNDTPKIVALLAGGAALGIANTSLLVAVAMAAGGLLAARRVAETMSRKITTMNDGQGFAGNLVTALLVLVASRFGLPVSTTHVSVGSLFGIGAATGGGRRRVIGGVLAAWVITLPVAAALAALTAALTAH
ncbi:MAG: inorganic phosphate transporter [Planctomycetota bacterium]|jgi:PiT family inorganic phosphate transporter